MVETTGCKSENTLDLKNPFFHYNGQPPAVPAGELLKHSYIKYPYLRNVLLQGSCRQARRNRGDKGGNCPLCPFAQGGQRGSVKGSKGANWS